MKAIAETIGWFVIIIVSGIILFGYVVGNKSWVEDSKSKGTICNLNKGWFEWPDPSKKKCIMYWDSLDK